MEVTRRTFLVAAGASVPALAVEDKIYDGGLAPVSLPGEPTRERPVLPAGARSLTAFRTKCVGCQLCVTACPHQVLRMSKTPGRVTLPEMSFQHGYCRITCGKCAEVCPAGAIARLTPAQRAHVHAGHAVHHPEMCIAHKESVACDACARVCPVKAIYRIPREGGVPIPVVDAQACIGCGACEHVCPGRPLPGMQVQGHEVQREVKAMDESDVLAEAKRVIKENKAGVVAYRDGVFTAHAAGRGIGPLLGLYDDELAALQGATVVDKIVGRAAAAICVAAGVKAVHGLLMSEGAMQFLKAHQVACLADETTPQIRNRENTGICPMEEAVLALDEPLKMIAAIRRKLEQLRRQATMRP